MKCFHCANYKSGSKRSCMAFRHPTQKVKNADLFNKPYFSYFCIFIGRFYLRVWDDVQYLNNLGSGLGLPNKLNFV